MLELETTAGEMVYINPRHIVMIRDAGKYPASPEPRDSSAIQTVGNNDIYVFGNATKIYDAVEKLRKEAPW